METHDSPPEPMTADQAIAMIPVLMAQLEQQDLTQRNIARMGDLLATCARENRPPTIAELEQVSRWLLPKPQLVAKAVHDALKGADHD